MKRSMFNFLFLGLLMLGAFGCHGVKVGPGEEAVLLMQPVIFGDGGVVSTPVKTGQMWVAYTTRETIVDMKPMQFDLELNDFMTSDGVPLDFHAVIRLRVTDSVKLIEQFGEKWYASNVQMEFATRVRQAVKKHGMNETAIQTAAIEEIDAEVKTGLAKYIAFKKLPVELIDVTVGKANPPDAVKSQRIETASQQQRALTEAQRKLAEDARKMAEESRAAADNAYRNAMSLDPSQFLALETIKMQREVCAVAGGHCSFIIGGGNNQPQPVINVSK